LKSTEGKTCMNYLNYEVSAGSDDVIKVTLDKQANVKLLDAINYQRYCTGKQYNYRGGLAQVSPLNLVAPYQGNWHVVVDIGGYAGSVRAAVEVIRG
jgi:hypothetical protein